MPDELHLVINPERSKAAEAIDDLATAAERPDVPADLPSAARRAADADLVGAVGGDGTQRAVAEAVAHRDTSLVVVPAGTVNLLGRTHGIHTIADARRAITDGRDRRIDLGRCNGEPFLLNAGTGYDADVIAGVGDRAKRFGRLGYLAVGVTRLLRARCHRCRVTVDGHDLFDGTALTVLVLNVPNRGSSRFELVPDATPDDGRLDVVVVTSRAAVGRAAWTFVRGGRPDDADAVIGGGSTIDVEWDVDVAEQRDGDLVGRGRRFLYTIEPGAVTLRVPR
jgi:diacylglycerol kinase (ATP)